MKRRILILTYTYFQLIVAIQLKCTEFEADDVDIIITNQSKGSFEVANRLRDIHMFQTVFYVRDLDGLDEPHRLDKYKRYLLARLCPEKSLKRYISLSDDYDMFLFHNASLLTHLICRHCGKKTECRRFEEGYSTYTRPLLEKKWIHRWMIRCAFGDIGHRVQGLYLFHPELFQQNVNYPLFHIKPLDKNDGELKQILNRVFGYRPDSRLLCADYIFLEESFRLSSPEIDDVDLVCRVAEIVGKERLVVKQHPRSPNNPFEKRGIVTAQSENIPWEVILMNEDFSDKTLLTVMSGTALAQALYFHEPIRTFLLFRCVQCRPPMLDDAYLKYIAELSRRNRELIIPQSEEDFLRELKY